MKKIAVIILVLGTLAGCLQPEATEKPETSKSELQTPNYELLIKQLGADDWPTREQAQKELEEIGPPAEPFLIKALQDPDSEIKLRVQRLLERLNRIIIVASDIQKLSQAERLELIRDYLLNHPELIRWKGVLGGKPDYYSKEKIKFISESEIYAYFEDGHCAGHQIIQVQYTENKIILKILKEELD